MLERSTCSSLPSSDEIAIGGSPVRSASSRSDARSSSSRAKRPEMYSPVRSLTFLSLLDADVPRLLHVLSRVGAECRERLCALNPRYRREDLGHDVRDLIVLGHANDRDEVPL